MTDIDSIQPDRLYHAQLEPDEGFRIVGDGTERWEGWRVRYREAGARRWRSFLLEGDAPNLDQLQKLCHAHATEALT